MSYHGAEHLLSSTVLLCCIKTDENRGKKRGKTDYQREDEKKKGGIGMKERLRNKRFSH